MKRLLRFLREDNGPTAVEYGVMLAFILAVVVGSVKLLGQSTAERYGTGIDQINAVLPSPPPSP